MIRASLLALLGVASFVAVYVATAPREPQPNSAMGPATDSGSAAETPLADASPARTMSISPALPDSQPQVTFELRPSTGGPVRNVTPPDMTSGPKVTGPLTRVEPPPPEAKARVERLFKPIVIAAGTIKVGGHNIRLAGITAPAFNKRCGDGEAAWPCGRMARAALRRFIRGRAIECKVPAGAKAIPDPAQCLVGGNDIAEWLVGQGWAKRSGDLYGKDEDAARKAKRGLWGERRPGAQAEVAASG